MAAEVPVSDVLCEAMEYLSKLGSNLRMRSEKLKEKRICKDKLRNAHAVHKAANKVLLICELSKKSLENVETGVRKVLSIVDASQASSVGGKTIDKKKDESNQNFYYFEYESHKLRISKKVSLKHFMSVRVIAKGMTASMQEKYPVFYDCKLKRRRRIASEKGKSHNKSEKSPSNSICCSEKNQNNEQSFENRMKLDKVIESDTSKAERPNKDENSRKKSVDHKTIIHKIKSQVTTPISDDEEVTSKTNDRGTTSETQDDNFQCKSDFNNESNVNLVDSKNEQESEIVKPKKALSESDRETDGEKLVKKSKGKNIKECQSKTSVNLTNLKINFEKKKSITRRKLNKIRVIDDSSESDEECLKNKCGERTQESQFSLGESNENSNTSGSEPKSKKIKLTDMDDGSKNKENSDLDTTELKNSINDLDDNSKPIIRCVNITKLLKPDVLDTKIDELLDDKQNKRNKHKSSTKCNTEQSKLNEDDRARKKKDKNAMQIKNDEEFWAQKRKEVNQFKPKQFDVNVERLPCLSINFLLKHNIKKIVQGCNTICELTKKKEKRKEHSKKKIDLVKSALLNDSESDDVDSALAAEANKVKNSLLGDSDSDKELNSEMVENCNERSTEAEAKRVKNSLLNDSDSDQELNSEMAENCNQHSTEGIANRVKNALLNDSDTDNELNSEKVEISNQSSTEAEAKRVKNSLLNDSDTDKELKSEKVENSKQSSMEAEAKRVKNSLLNDSDSDKELNSEMVEKNNQCNTEAEAKRVKNSLLNDSDSDKEQSSEIFENNILSNEDNITDPAVTKDGLLHDSDSDNNGKQVEEEKNRHIDSGTTGSQKGLEQEVAEKIKSALLNDSDSDKSQHNNEILVTPQEIISNKEGDEPIGSDKEVSDVSQNNEDHNVYKACSNIQKEDSTHEKIKSSLLNDSSDSKSESPVFKRKKRKLKHKRKHAIKSMQAKKMLLDYSSSSDEKEHSQASEEDSKKQNYKKGRKISDASSSSEEITNKHKKKDSRHSATPKKNTAKECGHSENENSDSRSIDQVDGTIDEHSDSSVSKMVRSKSKPSGSSGQNSDNQDASDKDIDGLTNLNNLNKTHRRRDSSSTNNTQSRSSTRKTSRSKPTSVIGEDLLQAASSSDASEDDHAEEDLPPVKLAGLNGDSIGHLAKDDLLGDSDSSVSQDKDQSEDAPIIDDSEEEENVKLKRRKAANAISSDSDGGAERRKQRDDNVRMSDFEESEDDSTESSKRAKRKKIASESDGSGGSSNDGGKKKRRRIKQLNDSDASGSDTENEGRNKHGRKNIRKVMGKNQLEEATKKAAREEKERIARIAERQKLYNNLEFDESGKPDEVVLEKVVLDFDPETKEPLIEVDRGLVKKLKPHQANGIKFMWDACFESVKRIKKDRGSGCILAHCMGLGKTLQVISLTHTLLIHGSLTGVNRVLVVCPLSTVLNWVNEFRMWLKHAHSEFEVDIYELSRYKQNSERAFQLQQWFEGGGVCVLGYEMFRNLSADNNKKFKKKMLRSFQESLVEPGPDLVVCDEGHLLKNEKTSLSQSMNRVKTRRRIVLTGTPLQNNLKEYYCMVQFVKPNLLGKYNEYLNRFVNPITNGQYTDSTEYDIKVMKRRSHVLHKMLDGAVQRRDYGVLAPFLPPKHEYVLFITLSDVQVKLYQFYLDNYSRRPLPGKSSGFLFPDFQSLQRIWTHPLVLKYNSERYEIMQQKKREREEEDSEGSLVDFIDDDSTPDESSTEESSDDLSDISDDSRKKSKKKKSAKKSKGKESKAGSRRGTRANPIEADEDVPEVSEVVEVRNENPTEWWIKLVEDEELDDMRNSHKLVLLFDILRQCDTIGDKLLVFSQSLYSLDLIEHFLGKVDEATQEGRIDDKLGRHVGSWSPGVDYFRLDGSTSCENRSIWCKNFNREDNPRARLFLISTRAGGLGINLVAANRVVIFDVSWNPSHDVQSIFRVYRFGQKKPCYVYRFLAMGTMEEKIYERQVTKQAISKRVIDEQQIDRHYAENDLAELYKFEARPDEPRPLPTLPKDRLFAEMLREHEAQIYKYHEHDSLLENKEEETLSEEERKAAWEDFENEKNKPPPAPFPTAWPGMVPGLLAQQQQQLAYAALASMLRKDMPNINDNQIRDMLPLIYNSNPGLMQKMSEIYKYAQPQMMNPGMMNPVMNPASAGAAAGGMGGTSGLQYEPPWQRQHQQQQQMRLQQLMQQNQQMGAKLYAGGLGSRDPVAMALQQQRAREIMMGGGGGANRPRGRPPLAPRLAAPAHDVVNLDSD